MMALDKYVSYNKGNMPIIISVPHGGTLEVNEIPKRSRGILGIDAGTIELARELVNIIRKKNNQNQPLKKEPSHVISRVRRSNIDLNREESRAYVNDSILAKAIYNFYHGKIKELISFNINTFDRSLLIDVHGFEKHKRPSGFRDVEIVLGTNNLNSLFSSKVSKKEMGNNIRGKIIKKITKLGIPIAPGHSRRREYVLKGGYITHSYGASQIPKSQSIQIEFSDTVRYLDKNLRKKVLNALGEILLEEFNAQ